MGLIRKTTVGLFLILAVCGVTADSQQFEIKIIDPVMPGMIDIPTQSMIDSLDGSIHAFVSSVRFWHFVRVADGWIHEPIDFGIENATCCRVIERDGVFYIIYRLEGDEIRIVRGTTGQWNEITRTVWPGSSEVRAVVDSNGAIWIVNTLGYIQIFDQGHWLTESMQLDQEIPYDVDLSVDIDADAGGSTYIAYSCPSIFPGVRLATFSESEMVLQSFESHTNVWNVNLEVTDSGDWACGFEIYQMSYRIGCFIKRDESPILFTQIEHKNLKAFQGMTMQESGGIAIIYNISPGFKYAVFDGEQWQSGDAPYSADIEYDANGSLCIFDRTVMYRLQEAAWAKDVFYSECSDKPIVYESDIGLRSVLFPRSSHNLPILWRELPTGWTTDVPNVTDCAPLGYYESVSGCFRANDAVDLLINSTPNIQFLSWNGDETTCSILCPSEFFDIVEMNADIHGLQHIVAYSRHSNGYQHGYEYVIDVYHLTGQVPDLSLKTVATVESSDYRPKFDSVIDSTDALHIVVGARDANRYILSSDDVITQQMLPGNCYNDALDIALDRFENPVVAIGSDNIWLSCYNGLSWRTAQWTPEDEERKFAISLSLHIDPYNTISMFVSYDKHTYGEPDVLLHLRYNGDTWTSSEVMLPVSVKSVENVVMSDHSDRAIVSGSGLFDVRAVPPLPDFNVFLDQCVFQQDDIFELEYRVLNGPSAADYSGVCLLEVPVGDTSLFYSIPSFIPVEEGIDLLDLNLASDEIERGVLCRFIWPETDHSLENLGIWSALLSPDLNELKSPIHRQSFRY